MKKLVRKYVALDRFSIARHETKTKVITVSNQNK